MRILSEEILQTVEPMYISSYEPERAAKWDKFTYAYTPREVEDLEERLKSSGYL